MIKKLFIFESLLIDAIFCVKLPLDSANQIWIPFVVFISSYIILSLLYLLYLLILDIFVNKKKEYDDQSWLYNTTTLLTMQWLLDIAHVKIKTTNFEFIPKKEKYIVVYNHTSNYDPIVQSWLLRKDNLIHLSKPQNLRIPMAGPIVQRNCYIPVDRENNREGMKSIIRAAKYLREQKYCIGLSPEGTRNKGDVTKLLPFRDGCFNLALWSKAPIVIMCMKNVNKIKPATALFKPHKVEVKVLDVLRYDEIKDLNTHQIGNIVRKYLQNEIDKGVKK